MAQLPLIGKKGGCNDLTEAAGFSFQCGFGIGPGACRDNHRAQGKQADKDKDVTKPVLINKVNPTYPEEAKKDKIQGEVILEAMIGQDGKVLDVTVKKSPDDRLSKSAMEAVKQWTFQPAKDAKGNVIKVKTTLTVNFRLK